MLVAFHGYGQVAEDVLAEVKQIPGISRWRIAAVQGLHRFYTRNNRDVIASWMTRQDRELAISDNVAYVDKVVDLVLAEGPEPKAPQTLIFLGFSQGAAMAYRAAALGRHPASGVIALAGDIPPELKEHPTIALPPVLIGAGTEDTWYTTSKLDPDVAFLSSRGVAHEVVRFTGGHEWREEFRGAAGYWLRRVYRIGT